MSLFHQFLIIHKLFIHTNPLNSNFSIKFPMFILKLYPISHSLYLNKDYLYYPPNLDQLMTHSKAKKMIYSIHSLSNIKESILIHQFI